MPSSSSILYWEFQSKISPPFSMKAFDPCGKQSFFWRVEKILVIILDWNALLSFLEMSPLVIMEAMRFGNATTSTRTLPLPSLHIWKTSPVSVLVRRTPVLWWFLATSTWALLFGLGTRSHSALCNIQQWDSSLGWYLYYGPLPSKFQMIYLKLSILYF